MHILQSSSDPFIVNKVGFFLKRWSSIYVKNYYTTVIDVELSTHLIITHWKICISTSLYNRLCSLQVIEYFYGALHSMADTKKAFIFYYIEEVTINFKTSLLII